MNRNEFDALARDKVGPPRQMTEAQFHRDFFEKGAHNAQLPPEQWPYQSRKARPAHGAAGELSPAPRTPCPHDACDGSGQRILKHNQATGTKTYALCPCRGGRA